MCPDSVFKGVFRGSPFAESHGGTHSFAYPGPELADNIFEGVYGPAGGQAGERPETGGNRRGDCNFRVFELGSEGGDSNYSGVAAEPVLLGPK